MSIKIHDSWKNVLQNEFEKEYFEALIAFVKDEINPILVILLETKFSLLLIRAILKM